MVAHSWYTNYRLREKKGCKMGKTIKEIKIDLGNNESVIGRGVYQNDDGSYFWITYSRSGVCKRLETAMKKAGIEK